MESKGNFGGAAPDPQRERPTLKTIAFMTGLGITTVSRALKDAPDIGAETKERVRMVARQLGYQPNRAGVRLRTGKTNVIALVLSIDEEIMGFTSQMVFGISEVLTGTPYHLVVTPHSHSKDPMLPVRYILDTGSADGVIISRIEPDDPRVRLLASSGTCPSPPTGARIRASFTPITISTTRPSPTRRCERWSQRGRRRIALLQPPSKLTYYTHTRIGFQTGLHDYGAEEVPLRVNIDTPLDRYPGRRRSADAIAHAPDGIVCSSGRRAIAVNAGIEAAGLRLGRDIDMVSKQSTRRS